MNCFQRDSLKGRLRLSALHGNNACTRNLGDRLRGCWQRKEWILSFLSLHTQRVLIHQNSFKIFDIDCCVPQGSCLGQILAELSRALSARSGAPWVRKFGYDVAYARPYRGLRYRLTEFECFFWRYPLTSAYFSNDHRLKFNFFKMHMK